MLTKPDASIIPVDAPSLPNPPTKSQRGAFIFSVVECFALELPAKLKLRDPLSLPVPQQSATLTQAKAAKAAENAAARKVAQEKTAQRREEARKEKAAAKKAKEEARDAARKKAAEAKKKKAAEPARKNPKVEQ